MSNDHNTILVDLDNDSASSICSHSSSSSFSFYRSIQYKNDLIVRKHQPLIASCHALCHAAILLAKEMLEESEIDDDDDDDDDEEHDDDEEEDDDDDDEDDNEENKDVPKGDDEGEKLENQIKRKLYKKKQCIKMKEKTVNVRQKLFH
jgi:hypothetical protein